jgi:hypothetical protein
MDGILWKLLIWMLNWGFAAMLMAFAIAGIFS